MARTARPVNPEDGPIQSFAFDLRAVREAAGNPTYRSLARTAGFSASTLSDAAGGVRLPSLEVTLAYVGACGAETAAWRARWQSVNRQLATRRGDDGGPGEDGDDGGPGDGGGDGRHGDPADSGDDGDHGDPADDGCDGSRVDPSDDDDDGDARLSGNPGEIPIAPTVPQPPADIPSADPPPATASGEPAAEARSGRRVSRFKIAALAAAVLVVPLAVLDLRPTAAPAASPSARATQPVRCPATPTAPAGGFSGETYGPGANVRSGASLSADVRERIPSGCTLRFSGYCLGDVVKDTTADTPDLRWFILPGEGEVASAVVHGNPPPGLPPRPCPDNVPGPSSITLTLSAADSGDGFVGLRAAGGNLWIVGFAAYYATGPGGGPTGWHQLALTESAGGSFDAALRIPYAAAAPPAPTIPVVAVACLGGDGPTGVVAAGSLPADRPAALRPAPLGTSMLAAAEQTACQYPSGA
ncbi:helix-turn-helix domain-containing protein [Actinospica sp. MGRD01-02]|uniref:Helix-turn-helix domain-containing protein n=1 Tax=Actinospica acidithermotolerans TaxID=2828514 RepID=A0A941E4K5_9ACTN|nr:helix-turn-helix transcriptional regulator [Actinospica acidithermotolerans]MBR7825051.1 helix-turn-helix domain-containing protein [Actinospica acidithermotolerans]